jgi:ABC-type phosphate transport system substrate-binding protein
MKKRITMMTMSIALCLVAVIVLTACGGGGGAAGNIAVISRDAVSGSRQSFDYNVRLGAHTSLTRWQETRGNRIPGDQAPTQAAVITAVAGNPNAIGYASWSAVEDNEDVKALNIRGTAVGTVNAFHAPGTAGYPGEFVRDFVILTPNATALPGGLLPRTAEFHRFLQSTQAQEVTTEFGLTFKVDDPVEYVPLATDPGQTPPIQIRGSTTVNPLMNALIKEFVEITGWALETMFDVNAQGSGNGVSVGQNLPLGNAPYTPGAAIGMSSNGLHNVPANGDTFALAFDITAVIVHKDNAISNITIAELYAIYTGAIRNWSALAAAA